MTTSVASRLAAPAGVAGLAASGCALIWFADPTTPGGVLPVCPLKAMTGLNCPGCGGLRMVYSLLHGDVPAALHYNAVAMVAVGFLAFWFVVWVRNRLRGNMNWNPPWLRGWVGTTIIAVFVVWTVVRNIPVAPFTALRV